MTSHPGESGSASHVETEFRWADSAPAMRHCWVDANTASDSRTTQLARSVNEAETLGQLRNDCPAWMDLRRRVYGRDDPTMRDTRLGGPDSADGTTEVAGAPLSVLPYGSSKGRQHFTSLLQLSCIQCSHSRCRGILVVKNDKLCPQLRGVSRHEGA